VFGCGVEEKKKLNSFAPKKVGAALVTTPRVINQHSEQAPPQSHGTV
jgi:hypothetical protein